MSYGIGIAVFNVNSTAAQAVQEALNDPRKRVSMHYIKTDETVKAQGPAYVAECALRWVTEVLNEAKTAGRLQHIHPSDIIICTGIAFSDILETATY